MRQEGHRATGASALTAQMHLRSLAQTYIEWAAPFQATKRRFTSVYRAGLLSPPPSLSSTIQAEGEDSNVRKTQIARLSYHLER